MNHRAKPTRKCTSDPAAEQMLVVAAKNGDEQGRKISKPPPIACRNPSVFARGICGLSLAEGADCRLLTGLHSCVSLLRIAMSGTVLRPHCSSNASGYIIYGQLTDN